MVQIAVIGSDGKIDKKTEQLAFEIGKEIAAAGAVLVCGGRGGVMEAACKGAKSKNGLTVGILPSQGEDANGFVDIKIPTNIGYARNQIVVLSADALITVSGGVGTVTEIAYAIDYNKPVVILSKSSGISGNIDTFLGIGTIKDEMKKRNARIFKATSAKEAVELAVEEAVA